ncbi:hypothetical protein [Bradyrhizobium elkanii]|uniref:hypothetical protein n=1 Tax=Bradyrhizobium elkanii TaxID=29448 RepID=UPI0014494074|nr:hypothetical protein [Bradyrhizobium elkanii]MCS3576540.1 putative DNA primase/helicase [Bradyrhizobium elkanii]MCS3719429.1 putative DNA primase/helicase [Bradyrhizobium elkanii]MCS4003834.1 putative DNA primase/helicase [Bradyrhizobium elkanii USDA 61]BBB98997.1 hypothetical protein BE61_44380 [Bradyrhizobium elkanii USDA 61]
MDSEEFDNNIKINAEEVFPSVEFGALSKMADQCTSILLKEGVPFYQRGHVLVRPVIVPVDTFNGKTTRTAQLVEVDLHYLRDTMCKKMKWIRNKKEVHPPKDVAMTILKRYGEWDFPSIAGIISTPTLRPDGTILSEPGFDPATRLLLVAPPPMPSIPKKPTKKEAMQALDLLKRLLREFPFADVEENGKSVSRSVALSAYLTTVCRAAFPVAPMHIGDAPVAASGKSYLLSTVAAIVTGQSMPVIAAGESERETEKRLGAAVIHGRSLICIDNVTGELGGDALCQLVEQPRPSVRVLGLSQLVEVEARSSTYFADGNNIVIKGDLFRRAVRYRLDPKMERPEQRTFDGNPMKDILTNRGTYIAAALTICRAYIAAGMPNKLPPLNSFNEWSDTVRSALVWLGEADPVKSQDKSSAEDPEKIELLTMLAEWKSVFGVGDKFGVTLKEVIERCNRIKSFDTITKLTQYEHIGLRNAVMAVLPRNQLDVHALGVWMRGRRHRIIGDMSFDNRSGSSGGATIWWVEGPPDRDQGTM